MIDTNIIISAWLTPQGVVSKLLKRLVSEHKICICTFSIEELRRVAGRKFPDKLKTLDLFLHEFSFEILHTPSALPENLPAISDASDSPILATAMLEDIDILLTGDKKLASTKIDRPQILTPHELYKKQWSTFPA